MMYRYAKENEAPTFEEAVLAAGKYNRGPGTFQKVCSGKSKQECMSESRKLCKKSVSVNKSEKGWYEGHRYMASLESCMEADSTRGFDFPKNTCP